MNSLTIRYFFFQIVDCDKGSFGVNCNSTCGHCRDLNHCFHIDGICLTECDAGYMGDLCETSRLKSLNQMKNNHCQNSKWGLCGNRNDMDSILLATFE